ncbi:MAG TPA: hypothetical protein DCG49_00505, partial [Ruminococcus sp.]|nr:hypothetical protein [Ruminococcus sp.]
MKKIHSVIASFLMSAAMISNAGSMLVTAQVIQDINSEETVSESPEKNDDLCFLINNADGDYYYNTVGQICGIILWNYDNTTHYESGESPITFTVEDESIAKIHEVVGMLVTLIGVSPGETTLTAETPDGRTVSVKVVIGESTETTTVTTTTT